MSDTIVFVPLNSGRGKVRKGSSSQELSIQKRFARSMHTAESDNFLSMIKTEKTIPKFPKSRSTVALSHKDQTVVKNGAAPEGFAHKEYKVSCGTLSALINHLTSDCDVEFRTTFLLTYRGFTLPEYLLSALRERFRNANSSDGITKVHLRVIGALKAWIENHWSHDFISNEGLQDTLQQFVAELEGPIWGPRAKQIQSTIERQAIPKAQIAVEKFPESILPTAPLLNKFVPIGALSPVETARQIAIYSFHIYKTISPSELLNQAWCTKEKEERSPNVLRLIRFFNKLASFSSQNIVMQRTSADRIIALRWFISLSEELFKLNDISSSLGVQGGLDSTEVNRLSRTWKDIGEIWNIRWKQLTNMTQSDKNHKMLRYHILQCDPPLVPFIGLYLKDLTFIEDGNPTILEDGLINMEKCTMVSNVIQSIQQYQELGYHLEYKELPEFQQWIDDWEIIDEECLFQRSLLIEPRKIDWAAYDKLFEKYEELERDVDKPPKPFEESKRILSVDSPKQKKKSKNKKKPKYSTLTRNSKRPDLSSTFV